MGEDVGDIGTPYAFAVAEPIPAALRMLAQAHPATPGSRIGRMVRLATASGETSIAVPIEARVTRAAVRFRFDQATSGLAADVTVFSDAVTAADDPDGALRAALSAWRSMAPGQIDDALAGVSLGSAADVSGRFAAPGAPWTIPTPPPQCLANGYCPPTRFPAAFLIKPQTDWPFGAVLAYGDGKLRHELRPAPGGLMQDIYVAETGPLNPVYAGRMTGSDNLYFLARATSGPANADSAAAMTHVVASLAAAFRIFVKRNQE